VPLAGCVALPEVDGCKVETSVEDGIDPDIVVMNRSRCLQGRPEL
jgi:hypothetical protein